MSFIPQPCTPDIVTEAVVTSVSASVTSVELLDENLLRKRAIFFNDSSSTAFLKLGSGATSSSYTVQLPTREFYHLDFPYVGVVTAAWQDAAGSMKVTEFE